MIGRGDNLTVRIIQFENYTPSSAANYVAEKKFLLWSLYREQFSPYAGPLSNRRICPTEFLPTEQEGGQFPIFILYANDRLTYGGCSWDLVTYRVAMSFFYCPGGGTFSQLELFAPLTENASSLVVALGTVACRTQTVS